MIDEEPAEVVGVRGPLFPAPFTESPPPAPPGRSRWWLPAGAVAAMVAALFLIGVPHPKPKAAAGPSAPASASEPPAQAADDAVNRALAEQSRALLGGDLNGYLAPVDAGLRDEFTLRFGSLRALGVAAWNAQVVAVTGQVDEHRWNVTVGIGYCLGAADCTPVVLRLPSTWSVEGGRAVATAFQRTVLPWDLTPLRAVAGRRVIVAAPAGSKVSLDRALADAERGAEVADRFARWGLPPQRYVVYLAGPEQWHSWWNGLSDDYAGYSVGSYGVEVRADTEADALTPVITHELTHVVSLGDEYGEGRYWWLDEGLAEYAADRDGGETREALPYVRRYLKAGRWDGAVTLGVMPKGAAQEEIQARYGLALLAVTCLARRFGEDRMLDFFAAVVRARSTPQAAAPSVFGTDWAPVAAACSAGIRARAA